MRVLYLSLSLNGQDDQDGHHSHNGQGSQCGHGGQCGVLGGQWEVKGWSLEITDAHCQKKWAVKFSGKKKKNQNKTCFT